MPQLHLGDYDESLRGIALEGRRLTQDSRDVAPGDVFVADGGLRFAVDAQERGAVGVLFEASEDGAGPGRYAITGLHAQLGSIADDFYRHPSRDLSLVGVTGTNGKTSTVQLIAQAWHALGRTSASIGTIGAGVHGALVPTGLTTPSVTRVHELLAGFRDEGMRNVAIEVSSHALEQDRVAGVRFDVVVFTNLSRDHLDYHGSMEAYAAAKARILDLPGEPAAVLNLDDERGRAWLERVGSRGIGVSSRGQTDASITGSDVALGPGGIRFALTIAGQTHPVSSPLIGRFNVDNLLATAGVLHAQDVDAEEIAFVLGTLEAPFGRMNRIRPTAESPLVVVDYAHTPDALGQSLAALAEVEHDRIITVFGATGERDRGKRPDMARIVEAGSDLVIVTDDDVHHEDGDQIVADLRAGFTDPARVVELRDRGAAIAHALGQATSRDIVLIAGKGHEAHQIVGEQLVPFSDTETAQRLLRERFG